MAWTHALGQLNPDNRDKILNFSTNFSEPKSSVNLDYEPKFHFGASPNQVLSPMVGLRESSQLNPESFKDISVSETTNFPRPILLRKIQVWSLGDFACSHGIFYCHMLK